MNQKIIQLLENKGGNNTKEVDYKEIIYNVFGNVDFHSIDSDYYRALSNKITY